jgi:hypothetical protein
MSKKILALVSEPVSGDALKNAVGSDAEDAEVLVVAPALESHHRSLPDPLLAIQDALQAFDADEIVLLIQPGDDGNWLEDGLVEDARERFDRPVRHLEIDPA